MSWSCNSCGSGLSFASEFSCYTVCGSCQNVSVRQGSRIELIGTTSELHDKSSFLKVGMQVTLPGDIAFSVLGSRDVAYDNGHWKNHYVRFDSGGHGWVSESMGILYVFPLDQTAIDEKIKSKVAQMIVSVAAYFRDNEKNRFEGQRLWRQSFTHDNRIFRLMSLYEGVVVHEEGSLPESAMSESVWAGDFRSVSPYVISATIPNGNVDQVSMLVGAAFSLNEASLKGGRPSLPDYEAGTQRKATVGVKCPTCGAGIELYDPEGTRRVSCAYCETSFEALKEHHQALSEVMSEMRLRDGAKAYTLHPGRVGELDGELWTVLGLIQRRAIPAEAFYEQWSSVWVEYLLHNPYLGYRWLTEYMGAYSLGDALTSLPRRADNPQDSTLEPVDIVVTVKEGDKTLYPLENTYVSTLKVYGEFYWRFDRDTITQNLDWNGDGYSVTQEIGEQEVHQTLQRYLSREELQKAFHLKEEDLPRWEYGQGYEKPAYPANVQNIYKGRSWVSWGSFILAGLVALFLVVMSLTSQSYTWNIRPDSSNSNVVQLKDGSEAFYTWSKPQSFDPPLRLGVGLDATIRINGYNKSHLGIFLVPESEWNPFDTRTPDKALVRWIGSKSSRISSVSWSSLKPGRYVAGVVVQYKNQGQSIAPKLTGSVAFSAGNEFSFKMIVLIFALILSGLMPAILQELFELRRRNEFYSSDG